MSEPLAAHDEIGRLRSRAENKRDNWLLHRGWQRVCNTPGSYWMWEKVWQGRTLLVETQTAEQIQQYFDAEEDYALHPERYED